MFIMLNYVVYGWSAEGDARDSVGSFFYICLKIKKENLQNEMYTVLSILCCCFFFWIYFEKSPPENPKITK